MLAFRFIAFLVSLFLSSAHAIYPLNEYEWFISETERHLLQQGRDMKACGFAFFKNANASSSCSCTLIEDDIVALPSHQLKRLITVPSESMDTELISQPIEGIVIFDAEIFGKVATYIRAVREFRVSFRDLLTVLDDFKIDYGIITETVMPNRIVTENDIIIDFALFKIQRFNQKATPLPVATDDLFSTMKKEPKPKIFTYGFGAGYLYTEHGWFRRGAEISRLVESTTSLYAPCMQPTGYKRIAFGLLGRGDQGGPLVYKGSLFGITRALAVKEKDHPFGLNRQWTTKSMQLGTMDLFRDRAATEFTPLFSRVSQTYLHSMIRFLRK